MPNITTNHAITYTNRHEKAVVITIPFYYLLVDLKTTTPDTFRLRTNILPDEEGLLSDQNCKVTFQRNPCNI